MKTRHLLIAALLLGGMTAFNACSDKDEVDNIIPPVDQPTEELETSLLLGAGLSDKIATRADEPSTGNKSQSYERIRNYVVAAFGVDENGQPAELLAYYVDKGESNPIFPNVDAGNSPISDQYGFSIKPLKFKTSKTQVAVVVLANCDQVYKEMSDNAIKDFASFESFVNKAALPLMDSYLNGKNGKFGGYPMSSNVYIMNITPGKYNTVGFGNQALSEVNDALGYYEEKSITAGDRQTIDERRISLYRCWSQVELTDLTVKTYTSGASEARFDLKGAFLMNVPAKTKLFASKNVNNANWFTWGAELNADFNEYISSLEGNAFYSGFSNDKNSTPVNSDDLGAAYTRKFRTKEVADNTTFDGYFNRQVSNTTVEVSSTNSGATTLDKLENTDIPVADADDNNKHLFNYIVSASNYGLSEAGAQNDKAMVLVVEGVYKEKVGGSWIVPNFDGTEEDADQAKPRYYTIVINEEGVSSTNVLVNNIQNTVMRNVKYEISAVIAGPGSDTPVGYLTNTYIVPKVTIVPFGTVKQTSEID